MREWNGFKEFGGAVVTESFTDDSGNQVPAGKKVAIADILGPDGMVVEIAWPDPNLVGGFSYTTAIVTGKQIRPQKVV